MSSSSVVLLSVVVLGAIAAFPLWLLFRAVKRGVWNGRGVDVYRRERPIAFWFGIVMYGVMSAIILSAPIYGFWVTIIRR